MNDWISVKERLPETKINPITMDFYQYPCIFKNEDVTDIRYYKFGRGDWWNSGMNVSEYVVAWMDIQIPDNI